MLALVTGIAAIALVRPCPGADANIQVLELRYHMQAYAHLQDRKHITCAASYFHLF